MKKPKPKKLAETITPRQLTILKKVCNVCEKEKPLAEFSKYIGKSCRSADGFRTTCKSCRSKREAERLRVKRALAKDVTKLKDKSYYGEI